LVLFFKKEQIFFFVKKKQKTFLYSGANRNHTRLLQSAASAGKPAT